MRTLKERLLTRTAVDGNGCWLWQGCLNSRGYGVISVGGERKLAHRVSYELHVGPIPDGLTIDHLCQTKACVNPEHLEPVTAKVNNRRAPSHGYLKPACLRGHHYTPENTKLSARGTRSCRECQYAAKRTNSGKTSSKYHAAKRALKVVPAAAIEVESPPRDRRLAAS
jgi:hypothetical protein